MKEEQVEELEALKAIYMDEFFTLEKQKYQYAIRVTPHFEGMYQNQLTLNFQFNFPDDYPSVPFNFEHIDITFSKSLNPEVVQELRDLVVHSSIELLGTPMVYSLIEKIKEHLEKINPFLNEGDFIMLSDETVMNIFEYLSPDDLGWAACVNKNWKRISEDPRLWKKFCFQKEALKSFLQKKESDSDNLELDWKNTYLDMTHRKITEMMFVAPVLTRRGTGDEWNTHIGLWHNYLSQCLLQRKIILKPELSASMQGAIFYNSQIHGEVPCGHYKFMRKEKGDLLFGKYEWMNYVRSLVSDCPYLGEIVGYFLFSPHEDLFTPKSRRVQLPINSLVIRAVIEECRSVIAQVQSPHDFIPSVVQSKILLGEVVNRNESELDHAGLLSNPRRVKFSNLYLTDLVNYVNRKLTFAISKEEQHSKKETGKTDKKFKNIRQYVEYVDRHGTLYPFSFAYWEAFAPTLSRVWIKIWHFNSLSYSLQGDFQKKLNIPIFYEDATPTQESSPIY